MSGTRNGLTSRMPANVLPTWMIELRQAAQDCIKPDDIRAIVEAQIAKAKAGDKDAMKFVFEQVLGGSAFKGATFNQTNIYGVAGADEPNGVTVNRADQQIADRIFDELKEVGDDVDLVDLFEDPQERKRAREIVRCDPRLQPLNGGGRCRRIR